MSKKNKSKHGRRDDGAPHRNQPAKTTAEQGARPRRLTPITVGIGLGVVLLGAAVLLRPVLSGAGSNALTRGGGDVVSLGAVVGTTTSAPAGTPAPPKPVATGLPPPAPGTRVPLNDVDPLTGKPITPSSPTTNYKGYVIGFCCDQSEGYRGAWARKSESEKDAFVRRYLK